MSSPMEFFLRNMLRWFVPLFLFLLPWQTIYVFSEGDTLNGIKNQYGVLSIYATEMLFWCTFLLFFVWFVLTLFKTKIDRPPFHLSKDRLFVFSVLLLTVYCFLSALWAPHQDIAFQHAQRILQASLLFFLLILAPVNKLYSASAYISGAIIQALLGLYQFFTQSSFSFKWLGLVEHPAWQAGTSIVASGTIGRWLRAYGSFSHPNAFGGYLVIALAILILVWPLIQEHKKYRLVGGVAMLLLISGILVTFSRSALIAALCVMALSLLRFWKTLVPYAAASVAMIALFAFAMLPLFQTRVQAVSVHETASITERVSGYSEASALFRQYPLFGVGVGNYVQTAFLLDSTRQGWTYQPVHSVPLLWLIELGIVGIILVFLVFISFFSLFGRRLLGVWLIPVGAAVLVLSLLDHFLWTSSIGLMLIAIISAFIYWFLHHFSSKYA